MTATLQNFFAAAAQKASVDLITAIENLPEDKRGWSPYDKGRSALDQAAECALLNEATAQVLQDRAFPADFDFEGFARAKTELAQDWDQLKTLLKRNTTRVTAAIQAIPDTDLTEEVAMPWGKMTLTQIISYPHWNMSYHEGQTNYIASLL